MRSHANDIPAAPPLEGNERPNAEPSADPLGPSAAATNPSPPFEDVTEPTDAVGQRVDARIATLRTLEAVLIEDIHGAINNLESALADDAATQHLEVLRSLLKAQVTAYLEHVAARRSVLVPHTSVMYAGEIGSRGVISTSFRSLLEHGTFSTGQAAKLSQLVTDRRTLIVFGEQGSGKSTLLNSLFDLISVDDRFVAIERGPDLPALKDRSFCVRLGVDESTDVPGLFTKTRRMNPGRLVIGEIHPAEMREFIQFLGENPQVSGLATLRTDSVHRAIEAVADAFDDDVTQARKLLARIKPVFAHMHADQTGLPRLAAIWLVEGLDDGELMLRQADTGAASTPLAAES